VLGISCRLPFCFLCSNTDLISSPSWLYIAFLESEIAMIFELSSDISFAKLLPALPIPCIIMVAFFRVEIIWVCSIAFCKTNCPPLAVAVSRPSEPPFSMDFPVTTALASSIGVEVCLEYSSTMMSMILALVYTSGAGMSCCGPITGVIFFMKARVMFSSSLSDNSFGLQITPPFPPPSGSPTVAVFIVIQVASAETSFRSTCGWYRIPPLYGPSRELCWILYPVNIFVESSSILTGKLTFVSRSVFRIMFNFSCERFNFSAAFFIIVFAFSNSIYFLGCFCF